MYTCAPDTPHKDFQHWSVFTPPWCMRHGQRTGCPASASSRGCRQTLSLGHSTSTHIIKHPDSVSILSSGSRGLLVQWYWAVLLSPLCLFTMDELQYRFTTQGCEAIISAINNLAQKLTGMYNAKPSNQASFINGLQARMKHKALGIQVNAMARTNGLFAD